MALSEKDRLVLDSIFNPLQLGGGAELDSWMIPVQDERNHENDSVDAELNESERKALQLEADAISLAMAEEKDFHRSIELLSEAIALNPTRANSYNNRAQVYRLLDMDELAIEDLTKALSLCKSKGNTAKNALCQRGLIYRKTKPNEDLAREDFKLAAALGSQLARDQLVELNPYAALCNQMLQEAFMKMN